MLENSHSQSLKEVLEKARSLARGKRHAHFGAPHLMIAIVDQPKGVRQMLEGWEKDPGYVLDWAETWMELIDPVDVVPDNITPDDRAMDALEEADGVRLKLGTTYVDPLCLFLALIRPGIAWSISELSHFPVKEEEAYRLLEARELTYSGKVNMDGSGDGAAVQRGGIPFLTDWFSADIVKQGKLTVGRDEETRKIMEVLNRQQNTGVLLVGEAGVGKTSVLQAFMTYLDDFSDLSGLKNAVFLRLDIPKLRAGANSAAEIESRFGKTVDRMSKLAMPVLLLDDVHILLEGQTGGNNILHAISALLSDSNIAVIATTTTEEFTKKIESNGALLRKMEVVRLEELDFNTVVKSLEAHQENLEEHHKLEIEKEALMEAARLSGRYFKERKLPGSAINLLDRTLSAVQLSNTYSQSETHALTEALEHLESRAEGTEIEEADLLRELRWLLSQVYTKVSPVLLGQITNETDKDELQTPKEFFAFLKEVLAELTELSQSKAAAIGQVEVAAMVAHQTGIPIGKIQAQEKDKLLNLEKYLKRRVVGQDQAIRSLADAIVESRSGLNNPAQPIGSFFFLGPTGTGKTELAKTLAEFLFNDEHAMIRLDMSEFKEEHSAALLLGAPPGYVGYEEGGLLVNKIRAKPYSVVLFDEIEKAHESVYDIFLQIMDEGQLHDRLGKHGTFVDSIVIFTSNLGSEWVAEKFRKGEMPTHADLTEIMSRTFRPEFLGRLTEIVPFGPITPEVVALIFDIQMKKLYRLLHPLGISLTVTDAAREHLSKAGYSDRYGARPVASVIRNQIRKPISRKIVAEEVKKGDKVVLDWDAEKGAVWEIKQLESTDALA